MAKTPQRPSRDIDSFIDSNVAHNRPFELPEKAIDDLRKMSEAALRGKAITFSGCQRWLMENYGYKIGRHRLHTLCLEHGLTPWLGP